MSVTVLMFDYRGYGKSEGSPHEAGVLADARAARKWLAERAKVAEQDIVLMGESIGGGIAVDLAAKDGARGLILEDTFTSLPDTAAYHYPWLPVQWLLHDRYDSVAHLASFGHPVLVAIAADDSIVPPQFGRALYAALAEPRRLAVIDGAGHNDWFGRLDDAWWQQAIDFLLGAQAP